MYKKMSPGKIVKKLTSDSNIAFVYVAMETVKLYFMFKLLPKRKYEGESISNQPDLFLTNRHSQDFRSVFGHHIKT